MKISELADATGVPVATIKFYLREKLLQPGTLATRTCAEYSEHHAERIRLVRALTESGGLGIAAVRRIIEAIDSPHQERIDLLGHAQQALAGDQAAGDAPQAVSPRVRALAERRGWSVMGPRDPLLHRVEKTWQACDQARVEIDEGQMDAYMDAAQRMAQVDVTRLPRTSEEAMRLVVVGTVMTEPLIAALRMVEQRETAIALVGSASAGS